MKKEEEEEEGGTLCLGDFICQIWSFDEIRSISVGSLK